MLLVIEYHLSICERHCKVTLPIQALFGGCDNRDGNVCCWLMLSIRFKLPSIPVNIVLPKCRHAPMNTHTQTLFFFLRKQASKNHKKEEEAHSDKAWSLAFFLPLKSNNLVWRCGIRTGSPSKVMPPSFFCWSFEIQRLIFKVWING